MKYETHEHTTFGDRYYPSLLEDQAEKCHALCLSKLGLEAIPLPVPVETWVEGPLGFAFGVEDLRHLGSSVLGAAFIAEKRIVISHRLANQEERFRFTVAHELGHMVLHGKLALMFRDTVDEPGQVNLHESEADRFATAFLMPVAAVSKVILDSCQKEQIDPLLARAMLLIGTSVSGTPKPEKLRQVLTTDISRVFRVSTKAAEIRLMEVLRPEVGVFMSSVTPPVILATG